MGKIGLYIRVSTKEQATDEHYSLDNQREEGLAYANSIGLDYEIYEDVWSGADITRVGITKLIEDVKRKIITIVWCGKIDRFSRDTISGLQNLKIMEKAGCKFVIKDREYQPNDPIILLLITMMFGNAEFERSLILQRTLDGKIRSVNQGNKILIDPLGYDRRYDERGKRVVEVNIKEAETVKYIFRLFVKEKLTATQIAYRLNSEGYKCKKSGQIFNYKTGEVKEVGQAWSDSHFKPILQRPEYTGRSWNYEKTELIKSNYYIPIIELDVWEQAQELLLSKKSRLFKGGYRITNHFVSGIIQCAECGAGYYFRNYSNKKSRKENPYYAHKKDRKQHKECSNKYTLLHADNLEYIFNELYSFSFLVEKELEHVYKKFDLNIKKDKKEIENIRERIEEKIHVIDIKINNFVNAIANGIDYNLIRPKLVSLQKDKEEQKEYLQQKEDEYKIKTNTFSEMKNAFSKEQLDAFHNGDAQQKRLCLKKIITHAQIKRDVLEVVMITGRMFSIKMDEIKRLNDLLNKGDDDVYYNSLAEIIDTSTSISEDDLKTITLE